MGIIKDIFPVFNKQRITFVRKSSEIADINSFFFTYSPTLSWKAGQHGIISFPNKLKGRSWRAFSLASSPEEKLIMISTRIIDKPSAFKKALMSLNPGEQVTLRGPFGPFYIDDSNKPVIFIAGGIGITPFRALIRYSIEHKNISPKIIRLLYSDDKLEYAFRDEFDKITSVNDFISIDYTSKTFLHAKIIDCVKEFGNNAFYYISGSSKMVGSIKKELIASGVLKKNVKQDVFFGL